MGHRRIRTQHQQPALAYICLIRIMVSLCGGSGLDREKDRLRLE